MILKRARENPRLGVDIYEKACENPGIQCDFHQWRNLYRSGLKNLWSCVYSKLVECPLPPCHTLITVLFLEQANGESQIHPVDNGNSNS